MDKENVRKEGKWILGLSCFYHDSAAALIRDGTIIAAAQEERFTRKKHDASFPRQAIAYCLKEAGLVIEEVNYVAFYEKPFLKFERIIETYLAYAPRGFRPFIMAVPLWIKEKLWMSELMRKELEGFSGVMLFAEHHESHAASAFYPSPFEEAAFLTIDGVGEWATTSFGVGKGNTIEILHELHFPHSLGLLYAAFTYFTGFKVNSGEYKVMGLAPYGTPRYAPLIYDYLLDLKEDGSFSLNMEYFNYCAGLTMTNQRFARLFGGPPRQPESPLTQREMDLAASIQKVTEEIIIRMSHHVRQVTGQNKLCLAGGVALNCVGNGKILRAGIFEDLWIQPAAGDAGGVLGAAQLVWHRYLGNSRQVSRNWDAQQGSYLGPSFSDQQIERKLKEKKVVYTQLEDGQKSEVGASLLVGQNVLGWFQGRMEFGPRALGSRSILGDPRRSEMQSLMNLRIKFRESFRPFAPSVLLEKVGQWFELNAASPYMFLVTDVVLDKRCPTSEQDARTVGLEKLHAVRSQIPTVTHVDYFARIQTVAREDHPSFYELIERFERETGCPILINTSFNVRGEPIVCTPEDALNCFLRTDMDFLIIGSFLLDKRTQPPELVQKDPSWIQQFELD